MKEIKAIIEAYNQIDKENIKAALATVVRVEGSSYRRTGARMLVQDDGVWTGGISGGCLEGDALKRAKFAIAKASASKITYDTSEDDEHQIGVGLGCNGIIDVLFTPIDYADKHNAIEGLKNCIAENRKTHVLLTITGLRGAWKEEVNLGKFIKYENKSSLNFIGDDGLINQIDEKIQIQLEKGSSCPYNFEISEDKKMDMFIEILPPEIHVLLMGFQYDVYPLTRLMKELGWRVSVVANLQKVNNKIAQVADAVHAPENLENLLIDQHTAIVLMSHDYKTDKKNLPIVLKTKASYIGMLGPRVRSEKIWRELAEEGFTISETDKQRIHAPVGLDIGAVTPEEIALSLAAEIRASFSARKGGYLRLRESTIHERA